MALAKPSQITVPFSSNGVKNTIPETATGSNLASMQEGFPVITMTDVDRGGMPPQGQDMNGILFDVTTAIRYQQAGGLFPYDANFAQAIDGYPLGALLTSADGSRLYQNTIAGNQSDPENGGLNWNLVPNASDISGKQDALNAEQLAAVNSGITAAKVTQYDGYATGKQDTLTFDNTPTEGSLNPVTSDGIATALSLKQDNITVDAVPTSGSANPVQSGGVYDALAEKVDIDDAGNAEVTATGSTTARTLANRFADVINVKDFGAKGDGVTDDTESIKSAIEAGAASGKEVVFPVGKYVVSRVWINNGTLSNPIRIRNEGDVTIVSNVTSNYSDTVVDHCFGFTGIVRTGRASYPYSIASGAVQIPRNDMTVSAGDLVHIESNRLVPSESRSSWRCGGVFRVQSVTSSTILLEDAVHTFFEAPSETDITVTEAIDTTHCKFGNVDASRDEMLYKIVAKSGRNVGQDPSFRWITDWDNDTKIATFALNSLATGDSNGNKAWAVAPAVGDVFTLVKELRIGVRKPIEVHINGLKFSRTKILDDSVTSQAALHLQWSVNSSVSDVGTENFPQCGIRFAESVNGRIFDCHAENHNNASGGYGISSMGNNNLNVYNCSVYGCRSGFSTGLATMNDINCVVDNLVVRAAGQFVNTGGGQHPRPFGQAWGVHGNGWECRFINCTAFDVQQATVERGYRTHFQNCAVYGIPDCFCYLNEGNGTVIDNCRIVVDDSKTDISAFLWIFQSNHGNDPVVVRNCSADNIKGHFVHISDNSDVVSKIYLIGNYARFGTTSNPVGGVGGLSLSTDAPHLGDNWQIIDNRTDYPSTFSTSADRGFFIPRSHVNIDDGVFVRIGQERWYVHVPGNTDIEIPLPSNVAVPITVSIKVSTNNSVVAQEMLLHKTTLSNTSWTGDFSPLESMNKSAYINPIKASVGIVSGKLNVAYDTSKGALLLYNRGTSNFYATVEAKGTGN